jgi:hypothetical protein
MLETDLKMNSRSQCNVLNSELNLALFFFLPNMIYLYSNIYSIYWYHNATDLFVNHEPKQRKTQWH